MNDTFLMKINEDEELDKDGFLVCTNIIPKGEEYLMHWHDYFEIEIILSGEIEYTYNQNRQIAKRGYAYLMSYYDLHSLTALTDVLILKVRFNESLFSKDLTEFIAKCANRLQCIFSEDEVRFIEKQTERIKRELKSDIAFNKEIVKNILSEIIVMIIRKSETDDYFKINSTVQRVISKMKKDFRGDISLNGMAEEFSLSPNYLGAIFKKNTGMSFTKYLNILRLKYACNLLKTSEENMQEIAKSSGYNSVEYFLYAFKKYISITPGEFRRNSR